MNRTNKQGMPRFLLLFAAVAAVAGCTNMAAPDLGGPGPFAAQVPFQIPAKSSSAATIRSLSVLPVGSRASELIARDLEHRMVGLKFREQPFYSHVILHELSPASVLAVPALQKMAQQDQTDGVLSVSYGGQRVDRRAYQETRFNCSVNPGFLKACPKGSQRQSQVSCEERTASVSVELRVFEARSRRVVYSDTLGDAVKKARCSDSSEPQLADNDLVASALVSLQPRLQAAIAPTVQLRPLDMMEPDSQVAEGEARVRFQEALQFARSKRLEAACSRFTDLYDGNKDSMALTYNVAFCDEAAGDLINAASRYHRASELARAPNSQIDRHLIAVERQIKENGLVPVAASAAIVHPADAGTYVPGGRRVALVVGNARYKRGALINPINDARLVQSQLGKLGFDVTEVEDVNSARFQSVIADFVRKSKGANVALFYYAGHAIQVDGENLLLPVDNDGMRSVDDVRDKGVALGELLARLDAAAPQVKLVVLDACRDNPLPGATRSLSGGLAPVRTPPAGSLIAYATSPGQTAIDGTGKNSVFTRHFVKEMQNPDQKLEDIFKKVRAEVQRETQNKQKPTEVSSMTGDFYFRQASRQ